jgi:hypothetical protein
VGGIIAFFTLMIQIVVMTPMFFEFGDAINETAFANMDPSVLTSWNNTYTLGRNMFWGFAFIIVIGAMLYVYVFASRKEYVVGYR